MDGQEGDPNCRKDLPDRIPEEEELEYGARDYGEPTRTYGDEASASRSRSRSNHRSYNDPSTLKKRYRDSNGDRTQENYRESEFDDQYTDPRMQHRDMQMGEDMAEEEYDDEGEDMGEEDMGEDESLMESNAHPYPRQDQGLEQRLE
mmetsp:Transcript_15333/g.23598  ORF Transcript_15333/g.23598 Transcript_15333/m.23598 type:complete len:147 (+) Transcript_15333:1292-1732(+)